MPLGGMPLLRKRAHLDPVHRGAHEVLVYSERQLLSALGSPDARLIIIAAPFKVTQGYSLNRASDVGRIITSSRATPLTVDSALDFIFAVTTAVVIEGVWVKRGSGAAAGDVGAFVSNEGAYSEFVVVRDCIISDVCETAVLCTGEQANGWRVSNNEVFASGAPNIDMADAGACLITGNRLAGGITLSAGSQNRIALNGLNGGNIDTSNTSGGNVIMGNVDVGTISAAATDVYDVDPTAASSEPLNT